MNSREISIWIDERWNGEITFLDNLKFQKSV